MLSSCCQKRRMDSSLDGVSNPADVQLLPGGRYLVAECMGKKVTERDRNGRFLSQLNNRLPVYAGT